MAAPDMIPTSVRALFPRSANRSVSVANAWRPFGDHTRPALSGWDDGWETVHKPATFAVLERLRDEGFTWVNLHVGGVAHPFRDAQLSELV